MWVVFLFWRENTLTVEYGMAKLVKVEMKVTIVEKKKKKRTNLAKTKAGKRVTKSSLFPPFFLLFLDEKKLMKFFRFLSLNFARIKIFAYLVAGDFFSTCNFIMITRLFYVLNKLAQGCDKFVF